MIELIIHATVLTTLGVLIALLCRQKESYFRSVQILFIQAFLAFATIILAELVFATIESEFIFQYVTKIGVSAALIAILALGVAASILFEKPGKELSWKDLCSKWFLSKKPNLLLMIYSGYTTFILILTWTLAPWQVQQVSNVWGELVNVPSYERWYLVCLSEIFVAFIAYPCSLFILSSRRYKKKGVARALRWFGVSWIGIGSSLIVFQAFPRSMGFEVAEVGSLFETVLFGVIAYFFKKTTLLESLCATIRPSIRVGEGEHVIALYTSKTDKMRVFASYIKQGLLSNDRVIYVYPDEEGDVVRARLGKQGVDVKEHEKDGSLVLMSLSQVYLSDGGFDRDKALNFRRKIKADTLRKGYLHERDLVDVGDLSFLRGRVKEYFEYLKATDLEIIDSYIIELRAANGEKLSEQRIQAFKYYDIKLIDLLEYTDAFSKSMGLTHRQVAGRKILLEYDPTSNYQEAIQDFITEALANVEPATVFTRIGSAIH